MFFPKLLTPHQQRVTVSRFLGYDSRSTTALGGFSDMKNLCADNYPALSVRKPRGRVTTLARPHALLCKDCLIWVDGATLYINGLAAPLTLQNSDKQMVSMGAYLLIWPDKVYINTKDLSDYGSMENSVTTTGTVTFSLCRADGTAAAASTGAAAPEAPETGALWLDTSGRAAVLRRYDGSIWQTETDAAVSLSAAGIGAGFSTGDTVTLSGCTACALDGAASILYRTDNTLVLSALAAIQQASQTESITVSRSVPDMDFVCECANRIWGCKYGVVDGQAVNAVYGSALGDFRNWNTFAGLSTDSYALTRGSDGAFTGCCAYLGSPIFFKEACMERLYVSDSGAHQAVTLQCDGVKRGSEKSLAVVDGTLYYHGLGGVYAFDGSMPRLVSEALGEKRYTAAVAGAFEGQYFLSLLCGTDSHLFVYNASLGQWYRQDDLRTLDFCVCDGELYALCADGIVSMHGVTGTGESRYDWYAETGELGLDTPQNKYLQCIELRLRPQTGATVTAQLSYDGGKTWRFGGRITGSGARVQACLLRIRPVRAPQLRLRLSGSGWCCLYSLSAVYEKGSECI